MGWGSWAETAAAWTPREAPSVRAPSHPEGLARSPRVPRPLPRRLLCLLILQAWGLGWPAGRVDRRGGGGHRDWAGHGGHGHWELGAGRGGLSLGREAWRGWAGFGLRSRVHGDRGPALASEPSLWRWALSVGWTVGPRSVSRVVQCEWVVGTHVQRGLSAGEPRSSGSGPKLGGRGGCDRRGPLVPSALGLSWKSWTSMCPWGCVCVCTTQMWVCVGKVRWHRSVQS